MRFFKNTSLFLLCAALCFSFLLYAQDFVWVRSVDFVQKNGKTILEIKVDGKVTASPHFLPKPPGSSQSARFYVDLEGARLHREIKTPHIPKGLPIQSVRMGQNSPQLVRIVFDVNDSAQEKDFTTSSDASKVYVTVQGGKTTEAIAKAPISEKPQIEKLEELQPIKDEVIEISGSAKEDDIPILLPTTSKETVPGVAPEPTKVQTVNKEPKQPTPLTHKKKFRVIIDPGHGGEDGGARGPRGSLEKDIALEISLKLKRYFEEDQNFEVFMTRESDKTLKLSDRTDFANRMKGDLFLSVHANASRKKSAAGVSTYFLHNADDEESLRVAMRENGELAVAKTVGKNVPEDYYLEVMKASMVKNFHTVQSTDLARRVQEALVEGLRRKYTDVKNLGVKSAQFYVLTGAQMPAILIETSFVSNRTEEQRLNSPSYQRELGVSVFKGVKLFLAQLKKH